VIDIDLLSYRDGGMGKRSKSPGAAGISPQGEEEDEREGDEMDGRDEMDEVDKMDERDEVIDSEVLTLPHPRIHERAFVLLPLREIAPEWQHPLSGATAGEMLWTSGDAGWVERVGPLEWRQAGALRG
jgi:hypothetical protein